MNSTELNNLFSSLHAADKELQNDLASVSIFEKEWVFLQGSETLLIDAMEEILPPAGTPGGDVEYGIILYYIQTLLPLEINLLLERWGMPKTQITTVMYDSWKSAIETGAGKITNNGSLLSTVTYALLDYNWTEAIVFYFETKMFNRIYTFGTDPANISLDDYGSITIAIMGDWGTGTWADENSALCPSQLVSSAIKGLAPDIVIHLGDVYYHGSGDEEKTNLLDCWTGGSKGSFTLNSNHEMYDGAYGYFGTTLNNSIFNIQQGTSYFAITFKNWIIFGLDSAYNDKSRFYLDGTLNDNDQIDFIRSVLGQPESKDKQIIVLTHHNAITYDGSAVNTRIDGDPGSLLNDVYTALEGQYPEFWYYGHLHNGTVYNDNSISQNYLTPSNNHPKFRCFGHGAIPFGNAYGLVNSDMVSYYAKTPMPDAGERQTNRVLNGFATITLRQGSISEQAYEVSNSDDGSGLTEVWNLVTVFTK